MRLLSLVHAFWEVANNRGYRQVLLRGLLPLLDDGTQVLDVGCDDGALAHELMERNASLRIVGIDIQACRPAQIPKVIYDGSHLPFPNASFDVVMAVDVLHHTTDIPSVLGEMARVSRRHVLIKDHVWDGHAAARLLLSLGDWCTNAPRGIRCVYNFPTLEEWRAYFHSLGLESRATAQIAHFPLRLNEKFNWIFLLEKSRRG